MKESTLSLQTWIRIFAIWTVVALSMATQIYLNAVLEDPSVNWLNLLIKQLPAWYLCALLTGVVIITHARFPLENSTWKENLLPQVVIAIIVLLIFSNFRLAAVSVFTGRDIFDFNGSQYITSYMAQLAWDIAIYVLITIGVFAKRTDQLRRKNELYAASIAIQNKALESQLRSAQLEALKLQLNPHFLFNSLNTVNSLIRTQKHAEAIRVTTMLGDLLREVLQGGQRQMVTLKEELSFVELYLGIELIRFSDRLTFRKQIEDEALAAKVPHFILQPIVENAIKHGIARTTAAKVISLSACVRNKKLSVQIYNDGTLNNHSPYSSGIGLKNVRDRLGKLYGSLARLDLSVHPNGTGVNAVLEIPLDTSFIDHEK